MKLLNYLLVALFSCSIIAGAPAPNYLYNESQVRFELYETNGKEPFNWLFLPGGPGCDSSYLRSLIDELELPGNVWLVDLPGNGTNTQDAVDDNYDKWMELFPHVVKSLQNPILVGHSFGGMFPLMFPELENQLRGFVILNSAPSLWLKEAVSYSKQFHLPDLSAEMNEFTLNPNQKTFEAALNACMPYYFPKSTLEKGQKLLAKTTCQFRPAVWWQRKALEMNFSAKWIPQNTPTLIVGGKYDCIAPFSLFEHDQRFHRRNITMVFIEDAGHMPWVENPQAVRTAFDQFIKAVSERS